MPFDLRAEDARWDLEKMEPLADRVFCEVLSAVDAIEGQYHADLLACDDQAISSLNAQYRDKFSPTNVLSWPSIERRAYVEGKRPLPLVPKRDTFLGDIAISYDTCFNEAAASRKLFWDHVSHLLVHGLLHLLGYDHETDADAQIMEETEVEVLGKMGIGTPY